ncbi:TetR/AcrR family transcriptional regulator [Sphaerobacter thermophilus]|uniref:Transcriptional regulator, TetR family n=1 Tax=Sphaerobacter thermophilus (strain ATCC 49802 / DSM 20745 / KCCM 41009 / NCIMB 13125 / S 6022) TaxID=479434 RepID=D1CAD4_SPHTD|nr:TetR/AcrR family transcriptional regulator [Sphaerobacter thermophilus]ACZ40777.1 transcriptional regulator, TetR family [Sphaerobacter thermophilus DSM 20745]
MARTKEFDPDAALQAAMELFWAKGYEATSVADLVEHLGIGRGSLYATFGDKHQLYLAALRRYQETQPPVVELLSQPGPVLPAVRALVERYAEEAACDTERRGCMLVNAVTERLPADRQVARVVEAGWDTLETALTAALIRARAQGELSPDKDPRALARFLLVVLQGIRVVGKGEASASRVRDAAAQAFAILT